MWGVSEQLVECNVALVKEVPPLALGNASPSDGYVNATAICQRKADWKLFSKRSQQGFRGALSRTLGIPIDLSARFKSPGFNETQGTLVHRDVAIQPAYRLFQNRSGTELSWRCQPG